MLLPQSKKRRGKEEGNIIPVNAPMKLNTFPTCHIHPEERMKTEIEREGP